MNAVRMWSGRRSARSRPARWASAMASIDAVRAAALGSGPSTVESVRLDPELKARLAERAEADGVPVSDVIRQALRHHLDAAS